MRSTLAAACTLVLLCAPAHAGPNSNGAIIVHTNNSYAYLSATVCTTPLGMPASCAEANTRVQVDGPAVIWFLAAFYPTASPVVASVYFGVESNEAELNPGAQFGSCGPAGTLEIHDAGWPQGLSRLRGRLRNPGRGAHAVPLLLLRGRESNGRPPARPLLCSRSNPIGGYAAFYDDLFPPSRDEISHFGCVGGMRPAITTARAHRRPRWAHAVASGTLPAADSRRLRGFSGFPPLRGRRHVLPSPQPCPTFGACCDLSTGTCTFELDTFCQAAGLLLGGACEPNNPCPTKGACCEPISGRLHTRHRVGSARSPSIWHDDWTCEPNNCEPPVSQRAATTTGLRADHRVGLLWPRFLVSRKPHLLPELLPALRRAGYRANDLGEDQGHFPVAGSRQAHGFPPQVWPLARRSCYHCGHSTGRTDDAIAD